MATAAWEVQLCYCGHPDRVAVFFGKRNGKEDEETCAMCEFEVIDGT